MVAFPKPPRIRITPNEVKVNRNARDPADINPELSWGKVIWKNMESGFQKILDLKEINEFLEKKIAN